MTTSPNNVECGPGASRIAKANTSVVMSRPRYCAFNRRIRRSPINSTLKAALGSPTADKIRSMRFRMTGRRRDVRRSPVRTKTGISEVGFHAHLQGGFGVTSHGPVGPVDVVVVDPGTHHGGRRL